MPLLNQKFENLLLIWKTNTFASVLQTRKKEFQIYVKVLCESAQKGKTGQSWLAQISILPW